VLGQTPPLGPIYETFDLEGFSLYSHGLLSSDNLDHTMIFDGIV